MQSRRFIDQDFEAYEIGKEKQRIVLISQFLKNPDSAVEQASLQKFTSLTPQYPGLRAPLPDDVLGGWLEALAPMLNAQFAMTGSRWTGHGWHSIVTQPPDRLLPIQRLPHIDGVEPGQIAMMLYLNDTAHGGTAFFRHKATGYESLTAQTFPLYKRTLEREVAANGLPPSAYVGDGEPYFEHIHESDGAFNSAVFYRGNVFHSGVIDPAGPFSADPRAGRYTINAFLRAEPGGAASEGR